MLIIALIDEKMLFFFVISVNTNSNLLLFRFYSDLVRIVIVLI